MRESHAKCVRLGRSAYIVFVLLALIQSTFTDIIVKIHGIDAYPGISLCVVGQLYAYAMGTSSTCV